MAADIPYRDDSQPSLVSAAAYRQLVDRVNILSKMLVKDGELKVSDANAVLTVTGSGGGGIPDGYEEMDIYVCIGGVSTLKTFLVKT